MSKYTISKSLEPSFEVEPSCFEMSLAYNWFAENHSWADAKKYIITYLINNGMKEKADIIKSQHEHEISWTCGWICRLLTKGSKVDRSSLDYLKKYLDSIKGKM